MTAARPLIGVLCCNEFADRPIQSVASRFIDPLVRISGAAVLLVPALSDTFCARAIGSRLDGLLLTGSRSNVAPSRYGSLPDDGAPVDPQRDEVALSLAGTMIESGKPVFGICRGLQELNVLFGGTLRDAGEPHHLDTNAREVPFEALFAHDHEVLLPPGSRLGAGPAQTIRVNSVHRQGIDRLGRGLSVDAICADDHLVEAFSSRPCGADVMAVQWHPEWESDRCEISRGFFVSLGTALRSAAA
jgi:putative glutamine amidotransferase